ncbi:hypothetical protein [Paramagnetospirillum caucaseum]|uniref:hypothetical protein n=1 Tax=Paramagnetospirillum caucaseum TaxID=1244869 RepID=UPI0012687CC5|nr:hypothetical protein [Paramagnetospirillum caucaseum]
MLSNQFVGYIVKTGHSWDTDRRVAELHRFITEVTGGTLLEVVVESQRDGGDGLSMIQNHLENMPVLVVDNISDVKNPAILKDIIALNIAVLSSDPNDRETNMATQKELVSEALSIHRSLYSAYLKLCENSKDDKQPELSIGRKSMVDDYDAVIVPIIKKLICDGVIGKANLVRKLERMRSIDASSAPTFQGGKWHAMTLARIVERNSNLLTLLDDAKAEKNTKAPPVRTAEVEGEL